MSGSFPDHFSGHAELYAAHRPGYPDELYAWLEGHVRDAAGPSAALRVWDCATGSGQAARSLAQRFDEVIATDASAEQIARATATPGVHYRVARAEDSGLESASVDLICAAAAAHWFDLDAFYAEVRRVARPHALVALWTYSAFVLVDGVAPPALVELALSTLSQYWPPQFALVRGEYRERFAFPFAELEAPPFQAVARLDLAGLVSHVRTWSGYQRCARATGRDPLAPLLPALAADWGDPDTPREVRWPLALRVGRVFG